MRPPLRIFAPIAAAAAVAGVVVGASAGDGEPAGARVERCDPNRRPLAVLDTRGAEPGTLVRVDPLTLESQGRRARLGGQFWSWDRSPDGKQLAIGVGAGGRLQLIELVSRRAVGSFRIGHHPIREIAWMRPDRLVALDGLGLDESRAAFVLVDPAQRRVLRRQELAGEVKAQARTGRGLAALIAPAGRIGQARLALFDVRGQLRQIRLRISAGRIFPEDNDLWPGEVPVFREWQPGLAVDVEGSRAFVVAAGPPTVAEVDLASGRVEYHEFAVQRSVTERIRDWIEPPAHAKVELGAERMAEWLGNGLIAVSGRDDDGDPETPFEPYGLRLINTGDWSEQTLDPDEQIVQRVAGALLSVDHEQHLLRVYELNGDLRFERRLGKGPYFRAADCYAYYGTRQRTQVIDLRSGRVVRAFDRRRHPPILLQR